MLGSSHENKQWGSADSVCIVQRLNSSAVCLHAWEENSYIAIVGSTYLGSSVTTGLPVVSEVKSCVSTCGGCDQCLGTMREAGVLWGSFR